MRNPARTVLSSAALLLFVCAAGCHSPWVQTTVMNHQDGPVKLVQVSYPGGTFGVQTIAAHSSYHYRFRILETGQASIDFTDAAGHDHTVKGTELRPGQEGRLEIDIDPGQTVSWQPHLTVHR